MHSSLSGYKYSMAPPTCLHIDKYEFAVCGWADDLNESHPILVISRIRKQLSSREKIERDGTLRGVEVGANVGVLLWSSQKGFS